MTKNVDCVNGSGVVPPKRDNYFWRTCEDRYIVTHRLDGYLLIAESMKGRGYNRTPEAIKKRAQRVLGINLSKYPVSGMRKCIVCGQWEVRPNSHAGRAGFCPACWRRRQAEAIREGTAERAAEAEYQKVKKRRRDERKRKEKGKLNNGREERGGEDHIART